MPRNSKSKGNGKKLATRQSVDQAVWSICDIMRRGNCAGAMQYVPELTWILFLRILDQQEEREQAEREAVGLPFTPSLQPPYRWRDWAAPYPDKAPDPARYDESEDVAVARGPGWKRRERIETGQNRYFDFINGDLLPHLRRLRDNPNATARQKVISQIMSGVERVRIDTERNFQDVLDKVHELSDDAFDTDHIFALSQVYEGLLLRMGEKGNDGGQFFTPRQVIKAMVRVIDPRPGETVYDPGCGTGGFLAESYRHVIEQLGDDAPAEQLTSLKERAFWGREKENQVYPIALANLILHGLDRPNIWHGNTLTGGEVYGGLFEGAPAQFDVILTNPPFGGKEGDDARTNFAYKTGATQVLFLQHVLTALRDGGRCGIVLDEGLLFRANEDAFVKTKKKLLDDCDLWCVVSLPAGVFTATGAGVKTNLLFFTRGQSTRKIWYYDLSDIKVGKKTPLTLDHFEDFFNQLPARADSARSWTVDMEARKRVASSEARPHKELAAQKGQQAAAASERVKQLKKAAPRDDAAVAEAEAECALLTKAAREAAAKAKEIEDAVYDLKAVNPNRSPEVDERTVADLLAIIDEKGREIQAALAPLRALLD